MEIPKHMCNNCYDEITSPYQIEKGLCHNCMIFNLGVDRTRSEAERLKKLGLNKHKARIEG